MLSDETLCAALAARLTGLSSYRLTLGEVEPDVCYASLLHSATYENGRALAVECRGIGPNFEAALVQLFRAADLSLSREPSPRIREGGAK